MTEFSFLLSDADAARLFALKAQEGERDKTGNEYAAELLARTLRRLHPEPAE